jgi:hypothetical protein
MSDKLGIILTADDEPVLRGLYEDILGGVSGLLDRYEIVEEGTIALAKAIVFQINNLHCKASSPFQASAA